MKLDELTEPECEDAADSFCERDTMYGTSELRFPDIVVPPTDDNLTSPQVTSWGEIIECTEIVPEISQMLRGTSRPGSSFIWVGSVNLQMKTSIHCPAPVAEPQLSPLLDAKPFETVSFYPCIPAPVNHDIDFRFGQKYDDGSYISGGIYRLTVIFDI